MSAWKSGVRRAAAVVNVHEAKTSLSRLVERARRGEDIVIARDGEPVIRLVPVAQRIVRAKNKIREAGVPCRVPSGGELLRHDLSAEAIRLDRLLVELLPDPEAIGLLALTRLERERRFLERRFAELGS